MNAFKNLFLVSAGAIAGIAFIMSCSDDSPPSADAAACDCPSAEAPITSSRLVFKSNPTTVGPGLQASQSVTCDGGGLLIAGGCGLQVPAGSAPDLTITQSYPANQSEGWDCEWQNNSATETYDVQVTIKCLMPPQ